MSGITQPDILQLVPNPPPSKEDFASKLAMARKKINEIYPEWPHEDFPFSLLPIYVSTDRIKQLSKLHSALHKALVALVQGWWSNPICTQTIQLPPKVERVLKRLDVIRPFSALGVYRPDWLIPESPHESFKICEINARLGLNAFYTGPIYKRAILGKEDQGSVINGELYKTAVINMEDIHDSCERHKLFDPKKTLGIVVGKEGAGHFLADVEIFAHKYHGNVRMIHPDSLRIVNDPFGNGWAVADEIGILDSFYIHLYASELETLDELLLLELGKRCFNDLREVFLVHDKATLSLLRLEADKLVTQNVLAKDEAQALRDGIVPTYIPGSSDVFASQLDESLNDAFTGRQCEFSKDKWVLKKRASGKGEGMVFGRDVSLGEWISLLQKQLGLPDLQNPVHLENSFDQGGSLGTVICTKRRSSSGSDEESMSSVCSIKEDDHDSSSLHKGNDHDHSCEMPETLNPPLSDYVLQPFVVQRCIDMILPDRYASKPEDMGMPIHVSWKIVGTSFCVNDEFMGIMFRTNPTDTVALSRGGYIVAATTSESFCNLRQLSFQDNVSRDNISASNIRDMVYRKELRIRAPSVVPTPEVLAQTVSNCKREGIAVLDTEFPDPKSDFLVNLTMSLPELGPPISHSSSVGILWDIHPRPAGTQQSKTGHARSETDEPFEWHTDCSYEVNPPRYFALHIVRADHKGGGKLRVLETKYLVEALPSEAVTILQDSQAFEIEAPKEFIKDSSRITIMGPILSKDERGNWKIRYRHDIIRPRTPAAEGALAIVKNTLEKMDKGEIKGVQLLGSDIMRDGTIVCLDNARWLHARSKVMDPNRLLRRVRWGAQEFVTATIATPAPAFCASKTDFSVGEEIQ